MSISGEFKYYLRDLYIFLFSVFISIVLAETLIFNSSESNDVVDKIFVYIYFIFPLFSLSLIASYIYRNIRIKQTGKVRSIIRYRLTLGFIFVSILPSIPVFLISSNVVGKLVESFYRIDISEALKHSSENIRLLEHKDRQQIFAKMMALLRTTEKGLNLNRFYKKALDLKLIRMSDYFMALVYKDKLASETKPFYNLVDEKKFTKMNGEKYLNYTQYKKRKAYIFVKSTVKGSDYSVIIGKRVHIGNESSIYNIIHTEKSYNTADLWKSKIPFALRLSLGIFTIIVFGISILLSFILARQISRPIVQLAYATQRVSGGETDVALSLKEEGEMGILIDSFNQMTRDLKAKTEEILHIQRIAAWKEVAQRMAHEIKNPLTPIQLSAERIRKNLDKPNQEKFNKIVVEGTSTIVGQVKVLEHLVNEFSEFARMPKPVLVNQKINPIVEEAVILFKESSKIQFELKLGKNLPEVFLDKKLFLGVVNNILKNAVEAIREAKETGGDAKNRYLGKIRITTRFEKKYLRRYLVLIIEDDGPGIPKKFQNKIFEPYFSTKSKHGQGIGLAIVEKTVYDHNGRITVVKSDLGGGGFQILLPVSHS
ncbi:MAG: ATP-binding protein [Spirochaetota bacterium]